MSAPASGEWLESARRILANISAEQPCRTPGVTCAVCATPVSAGYQRCYHCNLHRSGEHSEHLADLIVPLAYAWEGQTQLGKDVYRYKRDQGEAAATAIGNLAALLYTFGTVHALCPERQLGRQVTAKAVMPSLRGNPGTTLVEMGERFLPSWPWVQVTATGNYGDGGRSVDPAHFQVDMRGPLHGAHVLALEDTWVTGGHSQAMTIALKRAGATTVTVLPICLLLNPGWQPNATYSQSPHRRLWSPDICPVTGSACP
jgi:hypothetical protein